MDLTRTTRAIALSVTTAMALTGTTRVVALSVRNAQAGYEVGAGASDAGSMSERMSIRQPVSRAARRAF